MTESPSDVPRHAAFWADVLRRIVRRTRGNNDAEDLLHTAFLRLERYRATQPVENPAGFLVRTAVNIAVDIHRHDKFIAPEPAETAAINVADVAPLQDEVLATRARLERVQQGLAMLPPRTRDVFLMHRLEGAKYREIAVRLNISQSAVEKHIAKAALFLAEWSEGW